MTDGEWHHYVCVHTNGSTYLYIDGVKAAEALNKGLKPIDRKPISSVPCTEGQKAPVLMRTLWMVI